WPTSWLEESVRFFVQAGSRLIPATPSSPANLKCSAMSFGFKGPCGQKPLHAIQNRRRDARFALHRQRFDAVGIDKRDRVRVDLEAGVASRHVVGHYQVCVLALALCRGAADDILGFGSKSHEQRSCCTEQTLLPQ